MLPLLLACALPLPPVANADDADFPTWDAVDAEILAEMERRDLVAVSACVAQDGVLLWCQGYGWADLESETPATVDTPFLLASMSKPITTAGVLVGAEQGYVALDSPLQSQAVGLDPQTTLTHLLTHTASLEDDLDALYAATSADIEPDLESWLAQELARQDLSTGEPLGSSWQYSNTGIALAALELQLATQTPFDVWLEQELFAPLGLSVSLEPPPETALRYPDSRSWEAEELVRSHAWPAGFLYTTAQDYTSLLVAIDEDTLFEADGMTHAATEATDFGFLPYLEQGLGFQRFEDVGDREVWGHMGGFYGTNTIGLLAPDSGLAVVVLSTGGPAPGYRAWKSLTVMAEVVLDEAQAQ